MTEGAGGGGSGWDMMCLGTETKLGERTTLCFSDPSKDLIPFLICPQSHTGRPPSSHRFPPPQRGLRVKGGKAEKTRIPNK